MSGQRKTGRRGLGLTLLGLLGIGGCPPGPVLGTILALTTITFLLNQAGVIDVRANSDTPARSAGVFSLDLESPASDTPDSAQLRLGSVRAIELDDSAKSLQQSLTGSATVTVYCDQAASSNPCNNGVLVGDFELSINNGTVTATQDVLDIPAAALPLLVSGEFAVCLEVTATIDVRIIIDDMSVTFGEDTAPGLPTPNTTPNPVDNPQPNGGDGTPNPAGDTTDPTISLCPGAQQFDADENGDFVLPDLTGGVTASDNSGTVTVTQSPAAGTTVAVGSLTVTMTARDAAGNTATCEVEVEVSNPGPLGGGFIPAFIKHSGTEQIIAGSDIDPAFGLITRDDFTVSPQVFDSFNKSYALSGHGTRIWFRMLAPFSVEGQDRTQIWAINSDGTGAMRSPLPASLMDEFGAHLETNEDGSVCILNMDNKIMRADSTGATVEELYDYAGEYDFRTGFKVNDDGDRAWLVDIDARGVYTIDLNAIPYTPTVIISRENQAINARNPRSSLDSLDLAGDFPAYVFRSNYDLGNTVEASMRFQDAFWFGSGIIAPAALDLIKQEVSGAMTPYGLNISDDAQTFAYCQDVSGIGGIDPPVPCFVETIDGDVTQVGDGRTRMGGLTMSDNAARVFYVDSSSLSGSNGIIEDVGTGRKVAAGTPTFGPNWDREFVRVDDIGRNFVTNCAAGGAQGGLYVLSDGVSLRPNFPQIDGISFRFEDECTLRVSVSATGPRGLSEVYLMPLNHGVNPTEFVPGEDNPFFAIRNPSLNDAEPVEGFPGTWQFAFDLTNSEGKCARDALTEAFTLRVVAVDMNETVTVFKEFSPLQ